MGLNSYFVWETLVFRGLDRAITEKEQNMIFNAGVDICMTAVRVKCFTINHIFSECDWPKALEIIRTNNKLYFFHETYHVIANRVAKVKEAL